MKPFERIEAILNGKDIDRPCISLWKHFPITDRMPLKFIERTISFQDTYEWDFIKLCYNGLFSIEDWGSVIKWPETENDVGVVADFHIKDELGWESLNHLSVNEGALAREIGITREVVKRFKGKVPVVGTVFSPLTTAIKMSGDVMFDHIKGDSQGLNRALQVITETTIEFVKELLQTEIDGIFFATQLGTTDRLTVDEYNTFGRRFDLPILEAVQGKTWFNILHLHGEEPMFDELKDYPVQAINWHDRKVSVDLAVGRKKTDKILVGGIDEFGVLANGSEKDLEEHVREAVKQAGDNKLILGPGCVVPLHIPEERFAVLKRIVEGIK
ncbi:MAG: uroporphyrinogen decarboxylase [Dethiobacter sp.]|jgi:uroporphyrinogen decarboxylase|nr:uroporphyrinogen decarboxylase [Dethiobacter sp.]